MVTTPTYRYLESRPDKSWKQLFIRGTGVSASAIWRDCHLYGLTPEESAAGRDLLVEAVREALAYCDAEWDVIIEDRDSDRAYLTERGYNVTE